MKKILMLIVLSGFLMGQIAYAESNHKSFRSDLKHQRKEHFQQQKRENKEFRKTLKDLPADQRSGAITDHRAKQHTENKAFRDQLHQEKLAHLRENLGKNKKLTEAEKNELINYYESQYQENVAFRDKQHEENTAFFEKIAADTSLSGEQKKKAIKEHFKTQKVENKTYRKDRKEKFKEFKEKYKS